MKLLLFTAKHLSQPYNSLGQFQCQSARMTESPTGGQPQPIGDIKVSKQFLKCDVRSIQGSCTLGSPS